MATHVSGQEGRQLPPPQAIKRRGVADVVFCIDATKSMEPCIEGVKAHVQKLVEGFKSDQSKSIDWRVRLIGYRDLTEGEPFEEHSFTTSIDEFRRQIQSLEARGGGSEPESTLDAIFKAAASDWRKNCNKVVVVFTDAPTHPKLHESSVESGQANDLHEVINRMHTQRVRIFLYGPDDEQYEALSKEDRVVRVLVQAKEGLAEVDFAKLLEILGKTITATS